MMRDWPSDIHSLFLFDGMNGQLQTLGSSATFGQDMHAGIVLCFDHRQPFILRVQALFA